MFASLISIPGLLIAAAVFVVLFVILSVPLWISIVAAIGGILLWAAIAGGGLAARRNDHGSLQH